LLHADDCKKTEEEIHCAYGREEGPAQDLEKDKSSQEGEEEITGSCSRPIGVRPTLLTPCP